MPPASGILRLSGRRRCVRSLIATGSAQRDRHSKLDLSRSVPSLALPDEARRRSDVLGVGLAAMSGQRFAYSMRSAQQSINDVIDIETYLGSSGVRAKRLAPPRARSNSAAPCCRSPPLLHAARRVCRINCQLVRVAAHYDLYLYAALRPAETRIVVARADTQPCCRARGALRSAQCAPRGADRSAGGQK